MKTEYRYLAQDRSGGIYFYPSNTIASQELKTWVNDSAKCSRLFVRGQRNENWKETLIDLTKDDFTIEDGILTKTTHPHKAMRREWEESGRKKIVQYKNMLGKFMYTPYNIPCWDPDIIYRFKPEVMYCRMFEFEDQCGVKHITNYSNNEKLGVRDLGVKFIRWIGDVQLVEVT